MALSLPVVLQNLSTDRKFGHWIQTTVSRFETSKRLELQAGDARYPVVAGRDWGAQTRLIYTWVDQLEPTERIIGSVREINATPDVAPSAVDVDAEIPWLWLRVNDQTVSPKGGWTILENSTACLRVTSTTRVPSTMFVLRWWLHRWSISGIWDFSFALINSDPRQKEPLQSVDRIDFGFGMGAVGRLFYGPARGVRLISPFSSQFYRLMSNDFVGDRQALIWTGKFVVLAEMDQPSKVQTALADFVAPSLGVYAGWKGKWGPWGETPVLHPSMTDPMKTYYRTIWTDFVHWANRDGSLWNVAPFGLNKTPKDTGHQEDFGVTKAAACVAPEQQDVSPAHIYVLGGSMLQEGLRPEYAYEVDGKPFRAASHPLLLSWGLKHHYRENLSERMGKLDTTSHYGWTWHDFGHLSNLNLSAYAILSGEDWAAELLGHQLEWIKARRGQSFGEERAEGRVPLSCVWAYLATGDDEILDHFRRQYNPSYYSRLFAADDRGEKVCLFHDPTVNGRTIVVGAEWAPWHQGLHIAGLDAILHWIDNEHAERALKILCRTHVSYGWWWHDATKRWVVGNGVAWRENGQPLTPAEYQSRMNADPHYGTQFDVWCWPAVRIARRILADEPAVVDRCDKILAQLEAQRAESPPGFDLSSEWSAVS